MAKKSGKQNDLALRKLTATVEKLQARLKKAEATGTKWKAEAKRLEAEVSKRAKQVRKLRKDPSPSGGEVASAQPDASWTVLRLRAAAQEAGVSGYSRMTKATLLKALTTPRS